VLEQAGAGRRSWCRGSLVFYDTSEPFRAPLRRAVGAGCHPCFPLSRRSRSAGLKRSGRPRRGCRSTAAVAAGGLRRRFLRSLAFCPARRPRMAPDSARAIRSRGCWPLPLTCWQSGRAPSGRAAAVPFRRHPQGTACLSFLRAPPGPTPVLDADEIARGCLPVQADACTGCSRGTEGSGDGPAAPACGSRKAQQLLRRCPDRPASAIGPGVRGSPPIPQFHRVFRETDRG